MSLHINRFIDRLKSVESRQQRELMLTVQEARDLHADITKLLLVVEQLRESTQPSAPVATTFELTGGDF